MSAAMELHVALLLRLDATEAYRLAHAYRDEVIAERDAEIMAWLGKKAREYRSTGSKQHALQADTVELMASKIARGAVRPTQPPSEAGAAPTLTVYRASHDSIVMGLYTTAAAARAHCEAEERRTWLKADIPNFDWIEDEEDGVAEMTAWIGGEETVTGYIVTALEVASAYDEEADA